MRSEQFMMTQVETGQIGRNFESLFFAGCSLKGA